MYSNPAVLHSLTVESAEQVARCLTSVSSKHYDGVGPNQHSLCIGGQEASGDILCVGLKRGHRLQRCRLGALMYPPDVDHSLENQLKAIATRETYRTRSLPATSVPPSLAIDTLRIATSSSGTFGSASASLYYPDRARHVVTTDVPAHACTCSRPGPISLHSPTGRS